jgi:hypothetical protein
MNKFLTEDISTEELSKKLFNNTTLLSIESEELTDIEKDIIKEETQSDDPSISMGNVYDKMTEATKLSLALNTIEKNTKETFEKPPMNNPDEGNVIIDNDEEKKEYNEAMLTYPKTKTDIVLTNSQESENNIKNIWERFWDWIKTIFFKIRNAMVIFFKRVHIFLNNNMRYIKLWFIENSKKYMTYITTSENVTLNIRLPKTNFDNFYNYVIKEKSDLIDSINDVINFIKSSLNTNYKPNEEKDEKASLVNTYIDTSLKFKKKAIEFSTANLKKELYGEDSKIINVTSKQFFEKFDFLNLKNPNFLINELREINRLIRFTNQSMNIAKSSMSKLIIRKDVRNDLKKITLNYQTTFNYITYTTIWTISEYIHLINIAFRYCKKVVNNINI